MNWKEKKYQGVWTLVLVIVILWGLKLKYGDNEEEIILADKITPTIVPTINQLIPTVGLVNQEATSEAKQNKDYPLWNELPYQGEGFVVDKYIASKTLLVKLNAATKTEAVKRVNVWLKSFGDAGKGHKLEFESL